ncbi:GL14272 [Drosophila persimilis]|uniref:GL14272 n=1 Tax=Drosophila persimilis TaxID=7234 RepID=B4GQG6_DROPE|nr:GL14272 [Drosophila persimilis]
MEEVPHKEEESYEIQEPSEEVRVVEPTSEDGKTQYKVKGDKQEVPKTKILTKMHQKGRNKNYLCLEIFQRPILKFIG